MACLRIARLVRVSLGGRFRMANYMLRIDPQGIVLDTRTNSGERSPKLMGARRGADFYASLPAHAAQRVRRSAKQALAKGTGDTVVLSAREGGTFRRFEALFASWRSNEVEIILRGLGDSPGGLGHMGLPEPAALAHDLRGPITPILASAGMLQDVLGERADEDATMLAVNIQHGAEELMLRLDYLLAIVALAQSRSSLQLASWSMGPMLKEVKNGVAREARIRRQRVVVETPEDLPRLRADKHLVRLALIGVLQWGQRHSLQGATVTICAASAGEFVEVAVRHPGKSAGGEGQGLAISLARMVAQAHDGEFSVQQRKGPTVTYTLSLPVAGPASGGQV